MSTRSFLKTLILIYSEAIWLYFGLALYAKIQWEITELALPHGWMLACFIGYSSQYFLEKRGSGQRFRYIVTIGLLVPLITVSWLSFGAFDLGYRLTLILAGITLYLRAAYYVYKEPTRAQVLLRFEGNVLWYILFVLIIRVHPSLETLIHVPFMVAILVSLAGMTLTLHPEVGQTDAIKTKMVGNYSGLFSVISVLIVLGSLITMLLLINQVRTGLVAVLSGTWEGIGNLGNIVLQALTWLFSLTPPPETTSELIRQPVSQAVAVTEAEAVAFMKVPMFWIFMFIALLAIFAVLYFLPRMLPRISNNPNLKIEVSSQNRGRSFWFWFWQRLKSLWKDSMLRWRRNLPGFYLYQVYWNFHLLQKWGGKRGLGRLPHETPLAYGQRLKNQVPEKYNHQGQDYDLRRSVIDLVRNYGLVYYGRERVVKDNNYEPLMVYIKNE